MRIQLLFFSNCPHADGARALIKQCVAHLGLDDSVEEHEGNFPSPTILVNGVDVMGGTVMEGRSCRLDVPTEGRLLEALYSAMGPMG